MKRFANLITLTHILRHPFQIKPEPFRSIATLSRKRHEAELFAIATHAIGTARGHFPQQHRGQVVWQLLLMLIVQVVVVLGAVVGGGGPLPPGRGRGAGGRRGGGGGGRRHHYCC